MSQTRMYLSLGWLCVAIALEYGGNFGGDTSIICGFALLIWAAPFSILAQCYLYDYALQWVTPPTAYMLMSAFGLAGAYWFWFIAIPSIWVMGKNLDQKSMGRDRF